MLYGAGNAADLFDERLTQALTCIGQKKSHRTTVALGYVLHGKQKLLTCDIAFQWPLWQLNHHIWQLRRY